MDAITNKNLFTFNKIQSRKNLMKLTKSEILLRLYSRLRQSPCTIDILIDWRDKNGLDFHERSLYRYLNDLSHNLAVKGETIEVYHNEKNKKTWKLVFENSGKELSLFDINTFFLTKNFVPKSIMEQRKDSFNKIEELLYTRQSKNKFEFMADANQLVFGTTNFYDVTYTKGQQLLIEELIWAIQNKRKIIISEMLFDASQGKTSLEIGETVLPLSLKLHRGVLQLCCYIERLQTIFILSFDTLIRFNISCEYFNPKKYKKLLENYFDVHFGITQNMDDKVYHVELEFTQITGLFVKQFFWHGSQKWTILKNGHHLLKINCGINRELAGWIFQWMSNVQVRKPKLLKDMIIAKHQECLGMYDGKESFKYNNSFCTK